MRSWLILGVAAAAFAAFLVLPHRRAHDLLGREERALHGLRERLARGPQAVEEEAGYRFRWYVDDPDRLPPLLVAEPVEPGRSGVRTFAALPDTPPLLFERDPVSRALAVGSLDANRLRWFLSLPPEERTDEKRPPDWRPLEH